MCVIMISENKADIPTLLDLQDAEDANKDGAGIAWIHNGKVHWKKGLSAQKIHKMVQRVPTPFVVHFRYSTVDGKKRVLCHPFGMDEKVSYLCKGESDRVLFHNGHWTPWRTEFDKIEKELPGGLYTDSRLIAYLATKKGPDYGKFLEEVGGKFAVLDKDGVKTFGGPWTYYNGIKCSNMIWRYPYQRDNYYNRQGYGYPYYGKQGVVQYPPRNAAHFCDCGRRYPTRLVDAADLLDNFTDDEINELKKEIPQPKAENSCG